MRISVDVAWTCLVVIVSVLLIMACFGYPGARRPTDRSDG